MNARGLRTLEQTWDVLKHGANHAGDVRGLSLAQLARRVGVTQRHMQTVIAALEAAKRITRDVRRGVVNTYQLLTAWTRAMIDGEARAADREAAASEPAELARVSPRPFVYANLDHHPRL